MKRIGLKLFMSLALLAMVTGAMAQNYMERAIIDTDFTDWKSVSKNGGTVTVTTSFTNEEISFTLTDTGCYPENTEAKIPGEVGFLKCEKVATANVTTSSFANVTRVRYYHGATGSNRGWGLQKKGANDADWVTLSDAVASPAGGVWVECAVNEENVQFRWNNIGGKNYAFMTQLEVYANVEVTAKQVALTTAVAPAEAGTVSVAPESESYDEGTELTLAATENFGYDFVNWTNAAGEAVSTAAEFTYTINADETLTANFKAVETYELAMALEGGANDYMVSYSPAPTIVDGKQMYEAGTEVTVTATSNALVTFDGWDDGRVDKSFTIVMNSDKAYTATYKPSNYIVGWDFYKKGNNNRVADFASTSANESAAFSLVNENGETIGWLDKSTEAAKGYETFEGAAVNWKDLGTYWYQFQIDATGFTNIRVDAEMMFNYNAYTTILVQYSVDGTTWKDAGKLKMSKAKTEYPISVGLGEDANNAATLYVRFYPDKTAGTAGTESTNDGTTITNVFVYSDEQLVVTDGANFAPKFDSYTSATYTRKFNTAYNYGTICLPFAPDAATCANYHFYTLASETANALVFEEVTEPKANTAYLYTLKNGVDAEAAKTFTGGATTVSAIVTEPVGNWAFAGVFANTEITSDGSYYVYAPDKGNGEVLSSVKNSFKLTVKPYRAYFQYASEAAIAPLATMRIIVRGAGDLGDGTTAIEEVITPDQIEGAAPAIYNLMGQPVAQPVKGQIYIINGKKVVY